MLWLFAALLTLAAIIFVVVPLLGPARRSADRNAYSLEVYRDQLAEVEAEAARGAINAEEAKSARLEVERRMLALDRQAQGQTAQSLPRGFSFGAISVVVALIIVLPAFIYYQLGSPEQPGLPFVERPTAAPPAQNTASLEASIAKLAKRLKNESANLEGWMLLGQSYTALKRYEKAADVFRQAKTLAPRNTNVLMSLGESLVLASNGTVIPAARAAFDEILAIDDRHLGARFYLAEGLSQSGRNRDAFDIWLALVGESPADAPWLPALMQRLEIAASDLGIDLESVLPKTLPPAQANDVAPTPGPSEDDVAAANEMTGEERQAMIRTMVDRMARRLKDNPDDAAGWRRLARTYEVLGEMTKAREALDQAGAAAERAKGQASASADPGPDQDDVKAAAAMNAEERAKLIRGMVGRLAARLEQEPDDAEGWKRLAQSYGVLGEAQKAHDAWAQVVRLRPKDVNALMQQASAIINQSDRKKPLPAKAVQLFAKVLEIAPDNQDALYFSGLAAIQQKRIGEGRRIWRRLLEILPKNSSASDAVRRQLDQLPKE